MQIAPTSYSPNLQQGSNANAVARLPQAALATSNSSKFPAFAQDGDKVSLSDAGRALAQQAQQAGEIGEKVLGDLTRQTLSSLGITSSADALGAKIEFDSFSYRARSSTSISATYSRYSDGQGSSESSSLAFHSEQATEITGKGRITTADGRTFEFESQLQLLNKTDLNLSSQSSQTGASEDSNLQNIQALRGQQLRIADNSPLFSIIDDILQQIRDGGAANAAGPATAPPPPPQGIAIGEPNPNAQADASAALDDIFNLSQLNAGANKIAQQLKQLQQISQPNFASPQLAVAA